MSRCIVGFALAALILVALPSNSSAEHGDLLTREEFEKHAQRWEEAEIRIKRMRAYRKKLKELYKKRGGKPKKGRRAAVVVAPELNPGAAGSALTLVAGGMLVVAGRRRKTLIVA